MEITGINKYFSAGTLKKNNSCTKLNVAETFQTEVQNWKEKLKDKLEEELENDEAENLKMSDKQWRSLMKKVDRAINANIQVAKENSKVDQSKPNNDKEINHSDFTEFLKENSQLSTEDFLSLLTSNKLDQTPNEEARKSKNDMI